MVHRTGKAWAQDGSGELGERTWGSVLHRKSLQSPCPAMSPALPRDHVDLKSGLSTVLGFSALPAAPGPLELCVDRGGPDRLAGLCHRERKERGKVCLGLCEKPAQSSVSYLFSKKGAARKDQVFSCLYSFMPAGSTFCLSLF